MKDKTLIIVILLAVALSVFFAYQRAFVWQSFDLENSEEGSEEGVAEEGEVPEMPSEDAEIQDEAI